MASTAARPQPEASAPSRPAAPEIEWTEPAQPDEKDEVFWDTPLVRRYLEVYEDQVRQAQEEHRQHHRRAALRAALAGWDYPDALYITPGTGLRSVQIQRTASGAAVLA